MRDRVETLAAFPRRESTARHVRIGVFLTVAALALSCASRHSASPEDTQNARAFDVPEMKALIYVVRPTVGVGAVNSLALFVDRRPLGFLYPGTFQMAEVAPGAHKVAVTMQMGENLDIMKFDAEAGEIYFFRAQPQMGVWQGRAALELMPAREGRDAVGTYNRAPIK